MTHAATLLIVDDDRDLREALAEQLEVGGAFKVLQAEAARPGMTRAREDSPDLILLDVDLPDMDGRDACRELRDGGLKTPIIMLTGQDGETDTVRGLEAGANDYVAKPFRLAVLLARIRAHLRSHEQSEDAVLRLGPYAFRPASKTLTTEADGKRIRLTDKETSILRYLYRAKGKPVAREELLAEVWGYNAGVTTHTLETHIYRLRQKVEPAAGQARLLLTEAGGYRLQP